MAKEYWLIQRKFKDGDKYFISEVNYSEKISFCERSPILSALMKMDYSKASFMISIALLKLMCKVLRKEIQDAEYQSYLV